MVSSPIVSVLMPVYNGEKYLAEAIESVLNQTFTDFEFIIINDGSTDNSEQIIKRYSDTRIQYFNNEGNKGLIYSLNKGISFSKGKYIARMDADDISLPKRFEKQVLFLESHKEIGICGASAYRINSDGNKIGLVGRICNPEVLKASLLFSNPFIHPLIMMERNLIINNLYDSSFQHIEDYELWVRLLEKSKGANLPDYLLLYRWHDNNISVTQNAIQKKLTKEIVTKQLFQMGIEATNDDYIVHISTFTNDEIDFPRLKKWFNIILIANNKTHCYDQDALTSLLFSRWILASLRTHQYLMIFRWKWISPRIFLKTLSILKEKK